MIEVVILGDLLPLGEHRAAERCLAVVNGSNGSGGVDGAWAAAIAQHARATLSGAADDLEAAARSFADVGHDLVAAEMWATVSTQRQRYGSACSSRRGVPEIREAGRQM